MSKKCPHLFLYLDDLLGSKFPINAVVRRCLGIGAFNIRKLCILGKNVIEPCVLGNIEHRTRLQLDGLYDCLLVKFFRVYDDNATLEENKLLVRLEVDLQTRDVLYVIRLTPVFQRNQPALIGIDVFDPCALIGAKKYYL